jgi:hypothetical protein
MTEPANGERSNPHALIPPKPVDMEFVQALQEANIELLTIPVHMSHRLPSLDLGIFGVFNIFLRKKFNNLLMEY